MARHDPIAEIERDALDDSTPLATALRRCVVLGGKSGSEALRDWATRELQGYRGEDDLPEYRRILAPLMVDGVSGNIQVSHQQIPASSIPDFARDRISENLDLRDGVGGLEALLKQPEIRLQPPMASDLVRLINHEGQDPTQHMISLYWSVSPAAIKSVLDQIRTALTRLVAELRANMTRGEEVPSTQAADQAISVVVTGKRSRVQVTNAQASGGGSTASATVNTGEPRGFWTRWRRVGAFVVGAATVVGAVVAVVAFVH